MSKTVNEASLERMIALQKAYIDDQYNTLEMTVDSITSDVNRLGSDYTKLETRVNHLENNFIGLNGLVGFYNFLLGQNNITPSFNYYYTQYQPIEKFHPLSFQALNEWVPALIDLSAIGNNGGPIPIIFLLDTTNYLKYTDGRYAPTVGVPEDYMSIEGQKVYIGPIKEVGYIETDHTNLTVYDPLNNGGYWDSTKIWVEHERDIYRDFVKNSVDQTVSLVDALNGLEEALGGSIYIEDPSTPGRFKCVHRLRPWETNMNTLTIGMVNKRDLYLVEMTTATGFSNPVEGSANSMSGVRGIMYSPGVYIAPRPQGLSNINKGDTLDYSPYKLPPTALAPCPVTRERIENNPALGSFISKCFFSIYPASTTGTSSDMGLAYSTYLWEANINSGGLPNRQFPWAECLPNIAADSGIFGMASAESRNAKHWIAPGGVFAYNVFLNCLSLAYGTRDITSIAGSGISSNDPVNTLADVYRFGGISLQGLDYLENGQLFKKCYTFNEDSSPIVEWSQPINGSKPWGTMLSNGHPLEACMESQMVASFAKELELEVDILDGPGIQQAIRNNQSIPVIPFYGNLYYLIAPTKNDSPNNVYMTGNVCKLVKLENQELKIAGGRPYYFDLTIVLRMTLLHGMNLMGDIYTYCKGGYELTALSHRNQQTGKTTLYLTPYIQPDQTKWINHEANVLPKDSANISTYIQLPRVTQDMAYVSGGSSETESVLNKLSNSYKIVRGNYSTLVPPILGNMKGLNLRSGESYFAYLEPKTYYEEIRKEDGSSIDIDKVPYQYFTRLSTRVRGSALSDNASPRTVSHQETFTHFPTDVRGSLMQILVDPDSLSN